MRNDPELLLRHFFAPRNVFCFALSCTLLKLKTFSQKSLSGGIILVHDQTAAIQLKIKPTSSPKAPGITQNLYNSM